MNSPFQLGPKRPHRQTIEIEKDNYHEFYHFECMNYRVSTLPLLCIVGHCVHLILFFFSCIINIFFVYTF